MQFRRRVPINLFCCNLVRELFTSCKILFFISSFCRVCGNWIYVHQNMSKFVLEVLFWCQYKALKKVLPHLIIYRKMWYHKALFHTFSSIPSKHIYSKWWFKNELKGSRFYPFWNQSFVIGKVKKKIWLTFPEKNLHFVSFPVTLLLSSPYTYIPL